jgi:hypothetical protein
MISTFEEAFPDFVSPYILILIIFKLSSERSYETVWYIEEEIGYRYG